MNAHVPITAEIQDGDRDALHILPLATLPIAHPVLRRATPVKNAFFDVVDAIYRGLGGSDILHDVGYLAFRWWPKILTISPPKKAIPPSTCGINS